MALSGTLYTSYWGSNQARFRFTWSATQSVANNTSTISWVLSFDFPTAGSSSEWIRVYKASVTAEGTNRLNKTTSQDCVNGATIGSGSFTLNHDANGAKSFTVSLTGAIYSASNNVSGSGTITLNTIARGATSVTATNANVGEQSTITIYRATTSSAITYNLHYLHPTSGSYIALYTGVTGAVFSWTVPTTLLPNTTSSTVTIRCQSIAAGVVIKTVTTTMTATVPNTAAYRPSIGAITAAMIGSAPPGSGYVQGKTGVRLSVSASPGGGGATRSSVRYTITSNIKTATVTGSTANPSVADYAIISGSGTVTITAIVTDSRGRTASTSSTITVQEYTAPSITSQRVSRCDSDGTDNVQGIYFKVLIGSATITALGNTNTKSMKFSYSIDGGSSVQVDFTPSGYSVSNYVSSPIPISIDSTAEITIDITDFYSTTQAELSVSFGFVLMDFDSGGKSIGIGSPAISSDTGRLDIGIPTNIEGDVNIEGILSIGDTLKTANGYVQLPSGMILQWGENSGTKTVNFPKAFPNACLFVTTSGQWRQTSNPPYLTLSGAFNWTATGFQLGSFGYFLLGTSGEAPTSQSYRGMQAGANFGGYSRWLAIGY